MVTLKAPYLNLNEKQMLVIFNQVRPEKREEFVHFVNEVLCPAATSLQPESICHTRMLEPHVTNADGSFTYIVLLDPAFQDLNDPVRMILAEVYGEDGYEGYLDGYLACQMNGNSGYVLADKD